MEFLKDLVLIFAVSATAVFILHRVKLPSILGFIVAGVLIGPNGFGLIPDPHEVEVLAEIGVILLLFTIGIEFSLRNLIRIRRAVFIGGGGQVIVTIAIAGAAAWSLYGLGLNKALFIGFLTALSSTAIVLKMIVEKAEIDSPHGQSMLGILIFQDLCVVPMMLMVPILSGEAGGGLMELALTMGKAVGIIVAIILLARWVVPELLHQIVHTRSRELFLITVILICLGTALLTAKLGLSLALGAFLAGLVISESEYSHQATADVLPFRDSFLGLFFVSIGMLVDTSYMMGNAVGVAFAVLLIMALKAGSAALPLLLIGQAPRVAFHAGIGLAQIGEFSFILAGAGRQSGLIGDDIFQLFLAASVITMVSTPFLLRYAPAISTKIASALPGDASGMKNTTLTLTEAPLNDHVILIGFGLNGRNLALTLRDAAIPYVILDLNSRTVRQERKRGEPIHFGDATSREIQTRLGIHTARLLVVAISDPSASRKIVSIARRESQHVHIIVRTRFLAEVADLKGLGADDVIPEEFETSVEIFSRVLQHYSIPRNVINDTVERIRSNEYGLLRTLNLPGKSIIEQQDILSAIHTETYLIRDGSRLCGQSLRQLNLRAESGATVISVQRDGEVTQNPSPDFVMRRGDLVLLMGKSSQINAAVEFLESNPGEGTPQCL